MGIIFYLSEDLLRASVPTWDLSNQCSSAPVLFPIFFLPHFFWGFSGKIVFIESVLKMDASGFLELYRKIKTLNEIVH